MTTKKTFIQNFLQKEYEALLRAYGGAQSQKDFKRVAELAMALAAAAFANPQDTGEQKIMGIATWVAQSPSEFWASDWPTLSTRFGIQDTKLLKIRSTTARLKALAPMLREKGLVLLLQHDAEGEAEDGRVLILDTNLADGSQLISLLFVLSLNRICTHDDLFQLSSLMYATDLDPDERNAKIDQIFTTILKAEEAENVGENWRYLA